MWILPWFQGDSEVKSGTKVSQCPNIFDLVLSVGELETQNIPQAAPEVLPPLKTLDSNEIILSSTEKASFLFFLKELKTSLAVASPGRWSVSQDLP